MNIYEISETVGRICVRSGVKDLTNGNEVVASLKKEDNGLFFEKNGTLYARESLGAVNCCRLELVSELETIKAVMPYEYGDDEELSFYFVFPTYAVRVHYSGHDEKNTVSVFNGKSKSWVFKDEVVENAYRINRTIRDLERPSYYLFRTWR